MTAVDVRKRERGKSILLLAFSFFLLVLSLFHAEAVVGGVRTALRLCAETVVPTLFPFMILSDLIGEAISALGNGRDRREARKGRSLVPLIPFLLGALCGFPLGIRALSDLYRRGEITKEEGEHLVTFVNNTGPAFVIAGVGGRLFFSVRLGILFYLSQILAALLCALLFYRRKSAESFFRKDAYTEEREPFNLIRTVKSSALSALYITALTATFSALAALTSVFCKNSCLLGIFHAFLEVGGATLHASSMIAEAPLTASLLAVFSVSFGGFSVYMQSLLFLKDTPFPPRRYLLAKLLQGGFAILIFLLLHPFL